MVGGTSAGPGTPCSVASSASSSRAVKPSPEKGGLNQRLRTNRESFTAISARMAGSSTRARLSDWRDANQPTGSL